MIVAGESRMDQVKYQQCVALYERLLRAWNDQDAAAFGAAFDEAGSAVGFDGSMMNGREEITTTIRGIFRDHRTASYVAKIREVRELGREAALIRSVVGMTPPGSTELNPQVNSIQSVVMIGHGAQLRIALLHNTPAAFHGRPELAEELTRELTEVHRSGQLVAR
jgi:uncharacterized protein (TIGR02246 family)